MHQQIFGTTDLGDTKGAHDLENVFGGKVARP